MMLSNEKLYLKPPSISKNPIVCGMVVLLVATIIPTKNKTHNLIVKLFIFWIKHSLLVPRPSALQYGK